MPTIFGILPNVVGGQGASSRKVSQCWQVAIMAGKVPNLSNTLNTGLLETMITRDSRFLNFSKTLMSQNDFSHIVRLFVLLVKEPN